MSTSGKISITLFALVVVLNLIIGIKDHHFHNFIIAMCFTGWGLDIRNREMWRLRAQKSTSR